MVGRVLELKLDLIKEAQARVRGAFFALLLVSTLIILVCWYAEGSRKTFYDGMKAPEKISKDAWWDKARYTELMKESEESKQYKIDIIGLAVRVEDVSVIGPAALAIFFFYYAASSRLALTLIKDLDPTSLSDGEEREYARVSLSSGLLLNTADVLLENQQGTSDTDRIDWEVSSIIYRILIFLPVAVALVTLKIDAQILKFKAPVVPFSYQLLIQRIQEAHLVREWLFRLLGLLLAGLCLHFALKVTKNNKMIRQIYSDIATPKQKSDVGGSV